MTALTLKGWQQENAELQDRIAELEAQIRRMGKAWKDERNQLKAQLADAHEEAIHRIAALENKLKQSAETLNRIVQLSEERASPQWLREEIRKLEGEE